MFVRLQREFVKGRVGSCIRQATFPIDRFYQGTYSHECGSVIMGFFAGEANSSETLLHPYSHHWHHTCCRARTAKGIQPCC